jgi:hypothetical protein
MPHTSTHNSMAPRQISTAASTAFTPRTPKTVAPSSGGCTRGRCHSTRTPDRRCVQDNKSKSLTPH